MKKILFFVFWFLSIQAIAQTDELFKEAVNLERTLKEDAALAKYRQILAADPKNVKAFVRASELSSAIGARQTDKNAKANYYNQARDYADKAIALEPNNADAYYVRAVAAGKLTEVETENKKLVEQVRDIRTYAEKALAANPNHARANYVLGKWNFEVLTLSWAKKAAVKVLFGGMQKATIEDAYRYMEKCRKLEPYFVLNYLDLAKAYKHDHKPSQAIEVLNQLVKLPTRTADDAALKAEGKKLLAEMQ
jgi:predicted Zn-dependent protease